MSVEVPLTQGLVALVDEADARSVLDAGPWSVLVKSHTTYAKRNIRRGDGGWTTQLLHTFLTGSLLTDHQNGNGLDCRRRNLRSASSLTNSRNARRRSDNRSGFKGVSWDARSQRWRATIKLSRRQKHLGYHSAPEHAARAYDAAAREHFGAFATLNFPEPGERGAL